MSEEFLCPRRAEGVPAFAADTKDSWRERDGYLCCSYCGSLNNDQFFQAIEVGAELGPTDKSYKVYVDLPDPRAGEMKITGSTNAEASPGANWTRAAEADIAEYYEGRPVPPDHRMTWVLRTPRNKVHGKFYFQHLSDEEQTRFIELLNAKKINVGAPGYFYRLPFFASRAE
ncbi:hypothetical protein ACC717_04975 [Rhizobium ruizarguesonis]